MSEFEIIFLSLKYKIFQSHLEIILSVDDLLTEAEKWQEEIINQKSLEFCTYGVFIMNEYDNPRIIILKFCGKNKLEKLCSY